MKSDFVIRNIKWGLIYQIINMLMGFITPRFIMLTYGSEINGLQNSILQIINIIALLQAGVTSASVFMLYKPLLKKNYKEVSEILHSAVVYFRKVAVVFFCFMLGSAFIFTFAMQSDLKKYEIFTSFIILGLKTTIDILLVSKYLIVFTADQNKYIISIANLIEKIVYYFLLFIIIINHYYFIFMYIGLLAGTFLKIIVYKYRYYKIYNVKLDFDRTNMKRREITEKNYSMMNEISHTVVVSSIMVIISSLYNLKSASVFSVYYLVISLLITVDVVIYEAFASSFGCLVAEGNIKRINSVFTLFQYGFSMINTFFYMCAAYLIVPFVQIYTRGIKDIDYKNYTIAFMIVIFGIMYTYRIPYNICVSVNGFFKQTSVQPMICCIGSIIISVLLGKIRMEFVIIGPIFFYLVNYVYQVAKLKKLLSYMDFSHSIRLFLVSFSCVAFALGLSICMPLDNISITEWILIAIITSVFNACFVGVIYFLTNRECLFQVIRYVNSYISRRLRK